MRKKFLLSILTALISSLICLAGCGQVTVNRSADNSNNGADAKAQNVAETKNPVQMFDVELKSEPSQINAGMPATIFLTVKNAQGAVINDLSIVHEKAMHILIVSRDLAEFYHVYAERPEADGSYRVEQTFSNGGEYKIYTDFTPKESERVIKEIDVKVAGKERAQNPLQAVPKFEKIVDGLRVIMKPSAEITAGKELMLDFQVIDAATAKPGTDLQNYLGEAAHFVLISEDGKDFVHAHPAAKNGKMDEMKMEDKTDSTGGVHDHAKMDDAKPELNRSEVSAHTAFPRAGLYKIWAQFQRGGKVITIPFVVNVKGA